MIDHSKWDWNNSQVISDYGVKLGVCDCHILWIPYDSESVSWILLEFGNFKNTSPVICHFLTEFRTLTPYV